MRTRPRAATATTTRQGVFFNARAQILLGPGSSLALQPFIVANQGSNDSSIRQTTTPAPNPAPRQLFDQVDTHSDNRHAFACCA